MGGVSPKAANARDHIGRPERSVLGPVLRVPQWLSG